MTEPTLTPAYEGEKRDLLHDRRALGIIAGAVVVVAGLGYFVVVPLLGGSSSSSDSGLVPSAQHHVAAAASPKATKSSAAPAPAAVVSAAPALNVRDPFKPLVVVAAAAPSASASASPTAVPTVASQVPTIVVVQPSAASAGGVKQESFAVKLVSVSPATHSATFTVNGKTYKPVVGTSNASAANFPSAANGPFQLESVSASGVQLMYGSEASSLTTGQSNTFD
jgi:hypothetical protein